MTESIAVTPEAFQTRYAKLLDKLDQLERGVFDDTEGDEAAALALLTEAALIRQLSQAEARSKTYKRDVDFAKAKAYSKLKKSPPEGKKLTEVALAHAVNQEAEVIESYDQYVDMERQFKEFNNLLSLIKDTHITFRGIGRKG